MTEKSVARQEISDGCLILHEADLAEMFTGHVSYQIDEDTILIPEHLHDAGGGIESIRPENVVELDISDGETYDELYEPGVDEMEPPDEIIIHTALMRDRPEIKAVAHSHPPHATALSMTDTEIEPTGFHVANLGGSAPICDPGPKLLATHEDGEALVESMKGTFACMLRGHGAVTAGETVAEAVARMWGLERAAKLQILASQAGELQPFEGGVSPEVFFGDSPEEDLLESQFSWLRNEYLNPPPV